MQALLSARSRDPLRPRLLADRYELERPLGRGASGETFLARDVELARPVAVKVLADAACTRVDRFRREARLGARLRHPSIVKVHEFGVDGERPFLVMEYVDGGSLAEGGVGRRRMVEIGATLAAALHHAHEHGVVHRDVKPENVLLDAAGRPYLGDFGLARDLTGCSGETLSLAGDITGTPWSMAPEQARGDVHAVDARSDVYSLGATLYQGLTGHRPFNGPSLVDVLHGVLHDTPPVPRWYDPRIPRRLERVVLRCLEKDPAHRYQTAAELQHELEGVLQARVHTSALPALVRRIFPWRSDR